MAISLLVLSGCDPATNNAPATVDRSGLHAAPTTPPARICDDPSLRGPATAPADATVIDVGDDLATASDRAAEGTIFWLAPGTHRLEGMQYASVIPKDGQVFVGAPGAVLDGGRVNRYAFTGSAEDVTIRHLTIQNFGTATDNHNEGVVNHDSAHGWLVEHNTVRRNGGAGVFMGSGSVVQHNCLAENGQYGFSAYSPEGPQGLVLRHNEITGNNTADWESRIPGCGCTGGGKFWATSGAVIERNWTHDNHGPGLWADNNNTGFTIRGNFIADNDAEGIIYETSYNALIQFNTFRDNGWVKGPTNPGFPTPAIYVSESGSDTRAGELHGERFLIADNHFVDNWAGIVAWENADRFAGSPADTTGGGTLVNPGRAGVEACADPEKIGRRPWYDDCRWKTQHVHVKRNVFEFDLDRIGEKCTPDFGCGFNGVFSNWGTYPPWSPFHGTVVEEHITHDQDNVWAENTYRGSWRFMALEAGNEVSWDEWRGAPFGQDSGSSFE